MQDQVSNSEAKNDNRLKCLENCFSQLKQASRDISLQLQSMKQVSVNELSTLFLSFLNRQSDIYESVEKLPQVPNPFQQQMDQNEYATNDDIYKQQASLQSSLRASQLQESLNQAKQDLNQYQNVPQMQENEIVPQQVPVLLSEPEQIQQLEQNENLNPLEQIKLASLKLKQKATKMKKSLENQKKILQIVEQLNEQLFAEDGEFECKMEIAKILQQVTEMIV